MNVNPQKTCIICGEYFTPHPKVGDRQIACRKTYCQQMRKKRSRKLWILKNPKYFKGRYSDLKEKIINNKKKQETLSAFEHGIQDELTYNNLMILLMLSIMISIQDELSSEISITRKKLIKFVKSVYKTS
jgi:hypothetical protein